MSKTFKLALASMFVAAMSVATMASASAPASSFPRNLGMGATGSDVKELQMFLNACPDTALAVAAGATGSAGNESMTYGPATMNAVMAYQAKVGVSAVGAFGPQTRAQAAAMGNVCGGVTPPPVTPAEALCPNGMTLASNCMTAPVVTPAQPLCPNGMTLASNCMTAPTGGVTPPANNGALTGEGTVEEFSIASAEDSDFSEGQEQVELVAVDVELDDDGSLKMDRFDLYMGELDAGVQSQKPWDYFEKAYLMVDGKEVTSMDVDSSSDWDEVATGDETLAATTQEYKLRFSGLNSILPSDETSTVSVAFDIVGTLDSDDDDATWAFGIENDSFRFTDGTGFVFTDGDDEEDTFGADEAEVGSIEISESDENPDASVVEVSESTDTNGVTVAVVEVEETEGVDVNITEVEVTFTTSDTITDVVKKAYLYDGGTLVGSESVSGATVTFDNLDWDLDGDDKQDITVKVDLDDTNEGARYPDGTTLSVSGFDVTEATDEMDNDEDDLDITGTFTGETHTLYANGLSIDVTSVSTTVDTVDGAANDNVTFKVTFKATAIGDEDVYINKDFADIVTSSAATDVDQIFATELSGGAALISVTGTIADDSDATEVTGAAGYTGTPYTGEEFYKISNEETFTITITATNATDSKQVRAYLSGIEWTTDDVDNGAAVGAATINTYTSELSDDSKTPFKLVN
jgi:hypothetical protein